MSDGYLLYSEEKGSGETVVLLPGILSSTRFWDHIIDQLSNHYRVITLDPLGFGRSPKPKHNAYTLHQHLDCIAKTLEEKEINGKIILVGHSMGSILAATYANKYPERIKKLILISIPIFLSKDEAFHNVHLHLPLPRYLLYGTLAHVVCHIFCSAFRPITGFIIPLFMPQVPKEVAKDTLLHRYHSYLGTLTHVILDQKLRPIIESLSIPTVILYGGKDRRILLNNLGKINEWNAKIRIELLPEATHALPLEYPLEVIKEIKSI